jgi:hypothetical protein
MATCKTKMLQDRQIAALVVKVNSLNKQILHLKKVEDKANELKEVLATYESKTKSLVYTYAYIVIHSQLPTLTLTPPYLSLSPPSISHFIFDDNNDKCMLVHTQLKK